MSWNGLSDRVTHTAYRTMWNCNFDKCDGLCLHCARILGSHIHANRPLGRKSSSARTTPETKPSFKRRTLQTQTNRSKYNENIGNKRNPMFTHWFVLYLHRVTLERSAIRTTAIIIYSRTCTECTHCVPKIQMANCCPLFTHTFLHSVGYLSTRNASGFMFLQSSYTFRCFNLPNLNNLCATIKRKASKQTNPRSLFPHSHKIQTTKSAACSRPLPIRLFACGYLV